MSSKNLTRPLVMKDKTPAGKGTITVSCLNVWFNKDIWILMHVNVLSIKLYGLLLQICAEERTDNRVAEFEAAARKLDKKVLATTTRLNLHSGIQLWLRR